MSAARRLDSLGNAPETAGSTERGGAAHVAAEQVTEESAPLAAEDLFRVVEKARAVAAKVSSIRREADEAKRRAEAAAEKAKRRAHDAQIREALTRTELTVALNEALLARAQLAGRLRIQAFRTYLASQAPGRLRRHNRISRGLDRLLVRLGSFGQALVIARSGVWRGTGRALFDLRHMAAYARRRANPSVTPPVVLDQAWYLAANLDVAAARQAPLVHYLTAGDREGRAASPLFDVGYYRRHNAGELAETGVSALEHYVRRGAAIGRSPHPLFDAPHYLAQAPALGVGEDPVSHYLREGWMQGLSPHPLFDPAWYGSRAGRAAAGTPPLLHYLTEGWRLGLSPHPLFDPRWYLEHHPDVAEAGLEPLTHFLTSGADEGRSPGPWFDLPHYVSQRGAALEAGANPLIDYLHGGAWAVAEPRPGFPTAAYLAARPELVREGITPLEHWARRAGR